MHHSSSLMLHTADGGITWDTAFRDTSHHIFDIVHDEGKFYALVFDFSSQDSVYSLIESSDGGVTWNEGNPIPDAGASATLQCDTTKGYFYLLQADSSTNAQFLFRSNNYGQTWDTLLQKSDSSSLLHEMSVHLFEESNTVIITESNGYIVSRDGGITWQEFRADSLRACRDRNVKQSPYISSGLQSFLNDSVGFGFFGKGASSLSRFFLNKDSVISSVEHTASTSLATQLPQVWVQNVQPTPVINSAEIKISWLNMVNPSSITLEVYDVEGNIVADLSQQIIERYQCNIAECTFDSAGLSSGTYVVVAKANGSVHTKKTIKIQ